MKVIEELTVNSVVIGKQGMKSENYKKFDRLIKEKKVNVINVDLKFEKIQKLQVDDNTFFEILWPNSSNLIRENVLNNNSLVCKLVFNNFSMLFTGDIEEIAEKKLLKEYENDLNVFKAVVLKVAHHGSKTSSTQDFIKAVKPKVALIGVGKDNKFGHPNDDVLDRFKMLRL